LKQTLYFLDQPGTKKDYIRDNYINRIFI